MDELDLNLLEAWTRLNERCRHDPAEAFRRWQRCARPALTHPPRDTCLKLRAADTRITARRALIDPPDALDTLEEHTLTLEGGEIRRLCAPISIPWPGLPITQAAAKLGRKRQSLRTWLGLKPGNTRKQRQASGLERWETYHSTVSPLSITYDPPAPHGHFGVDVPVLWTQTPLDPGAGRGAPPHPLWGTLWQSFHDKIPDRYTLRARRTPRFNTRGGRQRFMGWRWLCPGLHGNECNRPAKLLFGPLPISTLAHFQAPNDGLAVQVPFQPSRDGATKLAEARQVVDSPWRRAIQNDSPTPTLHLSGHWHPGLQDPLAGRRAFACQRCWHVTSLDLLNRGGWNRFVTYLSGGLLYGHEVQKPSWLKPQRKRRPYQWRSTIQRQAAPTDPIPPEASRPSRVNAIKGCG